jgi:hypothetical protein
MSNRGTYGQPTPPPTSTPTTTDSAATMLPLPAVPSGFTWWKAALGVAAGVSVGYLALKTAREMKLEDKGRAWDAHYARRGIKLKLGSVHGR